MQERVWQSISKVALKPAYRRKGKNPSISDLINLGLESKLPRKLINKILSQTKSALNNWPALAKKYGVSKSNIDLIKSKIATH